MSTLSLNENGGATEVDTAVSIEATGSIRLSDTAKDSAAASNGQRHSLDAVWVGITRFLADFRERQSLDAEWEFQEMCATCRVYPAALNHQCFSCGSRGLSC